MSNTFAERYRWAAEILDPHPGEELLEIGCGTGEAADLIATIEPKCRVTAIDRSAKMAAAAERRNAAHIDAGRIYVLNCQLKENAFGDHAFDKIFVYNINVFWMDPAEELREIKRLLKPGGKFFLFHRPPPGGDPAEYAVEFERNLKKVGFEVLNTAINSNEKVNAVSVTSRP